jgi:hypothetical protein
MTIGLDEIAASLLRRLPPDGTPISNRAARALVTQNLAQMVTIEEYFAAREKLLAQRKIGRVRGQGGSVFLLPPPGRPAPITSADRSIPLSERALMAPLGEALRGPFSRWLDLPPQGVIECVDIAQTKTKGQWSNPDYLFVSVCPLTVLGGAQIDVHVFELKNEAGGRIQAVHEALAHGRFAHFAHLVWYVPQGSPREVEVDQIATHCRLHGVGLIRLLDADPTIDVLVDPVRTATSPLEIDGFVESRLSKSQIERLRAATQRTQ